MATAAQNATQQTKVITGKVRFSYAHVFEPWSGDPKDEPKYSVCLLIPKSDTATVERIKAAIQAAAQAGISTLGGSIPANLKHPLRDGDAERPDQPEYAGMYFVNANSKTKPGVVDVNRQPIMDTTEFYSGCYGHASVNFYAFNTRGNRGIACGLNHVMKTSDGDFLGGRSRAEDDFADLPVGSPPAANSFSFL